MLTSFAPVVREDTVAVVLGSMPGTASLAAQQYYGHPRNAFWPIMAELFQFDIDLPYRQRLEKLLDNNLGLWDVLQHCEREGSLDSSICEKSVQINDFETLFTQCQSIRFVFFNGRKAEQLFQRYFLKEAGQDKDYIASLSFRYLASTSPANAGLQFHNKLAQWKNAFGAAGVIPAD